MDDSYIIGYIEIPKDYWTVSTTSDDFDVEKKDIYWHHHED